jgi:periodic tryptophan protein 1
MNHHTGKVQTVKWHPVEESVMATAGFDRKLFLKDVRTNENELSRTMASDVESILWHPHDTHLLSVAAEDGTVETHDVRSFTADPLCSFKAHDKAVSAITLSHSIKNMFVTASPDQTIKVWNYSQIENNAPKLVKTQNPAMVNRLA